jgi:peptidoglycan/xylan/chitin deacetylase (PgdA/CDA1 family)
MPVTVLYYHRVGPPRPGLPRKGFVTPESFRSHMQWLKRSGWRVLALDELAGALAGDPGAGAPPRRGVVLTFDDGYADCAEFARPVLEDSGFPATFFIVAGAVGGTDRWNPTHGAHPERLMDWPALRNLRRAGFTIGSHTMTHRRLPELPPAEAMAELRDSRARLEEKLGSPVRHLSYPQGAWTPAVAAMAREAGYVSACATRRGAVHAGRPDPFALPRVPVSASDSAAAVLGKLVKGALGVYHWRIRKRGTANCAN